MYILKGQALVVAESAQNQLVEDKAIYSLRSLDPFFATTKKRRRGTVDRHKVNVKLYTIILSCTSSCAKEHQTNKE